VYSFVHEDVKKEFAGNVEGNTNKNTVFACISIRVKSDAIEDVIEYEDGCSLYLEMQGFV